jgi:DNA-directed RNA polymerase specialized sigma subunit
MLCYKGGIISMNKKEKIRLIEDHLKNYKTYLVGRKNIQESLDEIIPNGSVSINNLTENAVLDRIASSRVIYLREMLNAYNTIISSINDAVNALDNDEKAFIKYRYFKGCTIEKTAQQLGCSEQYCFKIRLQALDKLLISLTNLLKMTIEI